MKDEESTDMARDEGSIYSSDSTPIPEGKILGVTATITLLFHSKG